NSIKKGADRLNKNGYTANNESETTKMTRKKYLLIECILIVAIGVIKSTGKYLVVSCSMLSQFQLSVDRHSQEESSGVENFDLLHQILNLLAVKMSRIVLVGCGQIGN